MAKLPIFCSPQEHQLVRQEQHQHQLIRQEQQHHHHNHHHHQHPLNGNHCHVDGAFYLDINYHDNHHQSSQAAQQQEASSAYATTTTTTTTYAQEPSSQLQLPFRPSHHRSPSPATDSSGALHVDTERSESAPALESTDPTPLPRRSRGRPRLETQDRNASDRRRTQIRLAQRQYRQRKEAKLANLELKNAEQASLIDSMSGAIIQFCGLLLAEHVLDAVPNVSNRYRLQMSEDRLLAFAYAARSVGDDSGGSQASEAEEEPLSANSLGGPSLYPYGGQVNGGTGYGQQGHVSYDMADNANFSMYNESYQVTTTLPSPAYSYASQELSLGRWFQRASIEAGLRLVTMAHPPADRYAAVFGFGLFFEPRETIIRRLRLMLGRNEQQEGLLFATQRLATVSPAPSESNKAFAQGPSREYGSQQQQQEGGAEGEAMRGERLYRQVRMLLPGLDGELLDGDEVDMYLNRLGVFVPQGADVVEVDINVGDLDDGAAVWAPLTGEAAEGPATTPVTDGTTAGAQQPPRTTSGLRNNGTDGLGGPFALPPTGHNMAWTAAASSSSAPAPNWCPAKVTINTDVLVKELVHKFICVGTTPTVRRIDVNRAVRLAARMSTS